MTVTPTAPTMQPTTRTNYSIHCSSSLPLPPRRPPPQSTEVSSRLRPRSHPLPLPRPHPRLCLTSRTQPSAATMLRLPTSEGTEEVAMVDFTAAITTIAVTTQLAIAPGAAALCGRPKVTAPQRLTFIFRISPPRPLLPPRPRQQQQQQLVNRRKLQRRRLRPLL